MAFHHRGWLAIWFCLCASMTHAKTEYQVFGKQYCEIVLTHDFSNFVIYNSEDIEDCPHHWWRTLNEMKLKRKLNAAFVHFQEPHIWMVDRVIYSNNSYSKMNISGKKFKKIGYFKLEWNKILQKHGPYTDFSIIKTYIFAINQGRHIYQLKDPYGHYYVLYAQSTKLKDINQLKVQIKLPTGWKFIEGAMLNDFILNPKDPNVHIVQDNLSNHYQRVSKNLLEN